MRVGIWLDEYIDNKIGGGFSYTHKLVGLIDSYQFSEEINVVFVAKEKVIKSYNKEVVLLKYKSLKKKKNIKYKLFQFLINKSYFLSKFYRHFEDETKAKTENKVYRKQLIDNEIDVLYYLTQSECIIQDFPFISTNWDIGHLSTYSFPEIANNNDFQLRLTWYHNKLKQALSIFCESEAGKKEIESYLNISSQRIKVLPMFSGPVVSENVSDERQEQILKTFGLDKNNFFFYPAQFWAHKNHYNLLLGFNNLIKKEKNIQLVFTGSDKGNLDYITKKILDLKLKNNVKCLGFVEQEVIYTLYKNAIALVMPTFLGPTNMPLLEARDLGCPVLCSDFIGHREQMADGAIYFDPSEYNSIYDSMTKVLDANYREQLVNTSNVLIKTSKFNSSNAMKTLEQNLIDISKYRRCWN